MIGVVSSHFKGLQKYVMLLLTVKWTKPAAKLCPQNLNDSQNVWNEIFQNGNDGCLWLMCDFSPASLRFPVFRQFSTVSV